jgi:hypothetical protein
VLRHFCRGETWTLPMHLRAHSSSKMDRHKSAMQGFSRPRSFLHWSQHCPTVVFNDQLPIHCYFPLGVRLAGRYWSQGKRHAVFVVVKQIDKPVIHRFASLRVTLSTEHQCFQPARFIKQVETRCCRWKIIHTPTFFGFSFSLQRLHTHKIIIFINYNKVHTLLNTSLSTYYIAHRRLY